MGELQPSHCSVAVMITPGLVRSSGFGNLSVKFLNKNSKVQHPPGILFCFQPHSQSGDLISVSSLDRKAR